MTYIPSETAKEKLVFKDEYGNLMEAELQSIKNGTYTGDGGEKFNGFLVGIMNSASHVEGYSVKNPTSYEEKDRADRKMKQSSEKFYQDYPEELKAALGRVSEEAYKANPDNYKTLLLVHYCHKQTEKFIQQCVETGQATHMMLIYNDQMNKIANGETAYYSWKQIIGEQSLNAPQEEVQRSIENSQTAETMRNQSTANGAKRNLWKKQHQQQNEQENTSNTPQSTHTQGKDYKGTSLSLPQKRGYSRDD